MTPLDSLKAGIKTAIFTFLTGLLFAVVGLLNALNDYISKGDPIDWGVARSATFALVAALAVGVINTIVRYVQVAGVPGITAVLDRVFGAVPAYPEKAANKVIEATATDVAGEIPTITNTSPKEGVQ